MGRGLILIAGVAGLAALPVADAAGGGGGGGGKPDLKYVASKTKTVMPGKVGKARVKCPDGTVAIGGGVQIPDSNTATGVTGSYPLDDSDRNRRPEDGWRGTISSRSAGPKHMRVHAVCSRTGTYRYLSSVAPVQPNGSTAQTPKCPGNNGLTGGGVKTPPGHPEIYVEASTPFDAEVAGDADDNPDDSWNALVQNHSDDGITSTTYLICARSGFNAYRFAAGEIEVNGGSQGKLKATCPGASHVVSGGGELFIPAGTEMAGTFPIDTSHDGRADDGWSVRWNNQNGPGDNFILQIRAICRR
jgi:hypothetical protein